MPLKSPQRYARRRSSVLLLTHLPKIRLNAGFKTKANSAPLPTSRIFHLLILRSNGYRTHREKVSDSITYVPFIYYKAKIKHKPFKLVIECLSPKWFLAGCWYLATPFFPRLAPNRCSKPQFQLQKDSYLGYQSREVLFPCHPPRRQSRFTFEQVSLDGHRWLPIEEIFVLRIFWSGFFMKRIVRNHLHDIKNINR